MYRKKKLPWRKPDLHGVDCVNMLVCKSLLRHAAAKISEL
jgi:hypothetical protein